MMEWVLAATLHDPDERLLALFEPRLGELAALYRCRAVACSAAMSKQTLLALEKNGFEVVPSGTAGVGAARRMAVRHVWPAVEGTWIHYIDLDRLLHWHYTYPAELRATLQSQPRAEYVALGRTERALASHPRVQVLAETLTNAAFAALVGLEGNVDLVAGSCLLSRRAAEIILAQSAEPTNATDLEWPALVLRELGALPECRLVEGLEFETADCYRCEIRQAGSREAWIAATYDVPQMWLARAKLAQDSIAALARVSGAARLDPH